MELENKLTPHQKASWAISLTNLEIAVRNHAANPTNVNRVKRFRAMQGFKANYGSSLTHEEMMHIYNSMIAQFNIG